MSCENNPNILTNNCQLVQGCSDIEVNARQISATGDISPFLPPVEVMRVPVLLTQVVLEQSLIDDVIIPEGFSEIKLISKKVIINQAKLVLNHLIIEGYVLKNISYVTPEPVTTDTGVCQAYRNTWKDIEVKVPFSQGLSIDGLFYPVFPRFTAEAPIGCNTMKGKCCDKGFMGDSLCENLRGDFELLNRPPYAELVAYDIIELDINRKPCENTTDTNLYGVFTEKLLVNLVINIFRDEYRPTTTFAPGLVAQEMPVPTSKMSNFTK